MIFKKTKQLKQKLGLQTKSLRRQTTSLTIPNLMSRRYNKLRGGDIAKQSKI